MKVPLERRTVPVSAGRMACVDMGDGPPALLLHGFPASSFLWRREAWLLAQRMRVLAPDLIGYGASDKPMDADLSERAQLGYLRELLERMGVRELAVVGHGVGGVLALLLAVDAPELEVRSLVVLGAPALPGSRQDNMPRAEAGAETEAWASTTVRGILERGIAHPELVTEELVAGYVDPWRADPGALRRAGSALGTTTLARRETELRRREQPVFLVWGEDDPFVPSEVGERLGDLLAGSTLALLPGCSHFVNEDAPQTVGPLIAEYLRSRYLGERHAHAGGPVPVFLERPGPERHEGGDEEP